VKQIYAETEEESSYEILGPEESDIKRGQISVSSPLARALIGHVVGDEVTVRLPTGTRVYEIQSITFG
jgi:transcription elongation factor GreA